MLSKKNEVNNHSSTEIGRIGSATGLSLNSPRETTSSGSDSSNGSTESRWSWVRKYIPLPALGELPGVLTAFFSFGLGQGISLTTNNSLLSIYSAAAGPQAGIAVSQRRSRKKLRQKIKSLEEDAKKLQARLDANKTLLGPDKMKFLAELIEDAVATIGAAKARGNFDFYKELVDVIFSLFFLARCGIEFSRLGAPNENGDMINALPYIDCIFFSLSAYFCWLGNSRLNETNLLISDAENDGSAIRTIMKLGLEQLSQNNQATNSNVPSAQPEQSIQPSPAITITSNIDIDIELQGSAAIAAANSALRVEQSIHKIVTEDQTGIGGGSHRRKDKKKKYGEDGPPDMAPPRPPIQSQYVPVQPPTSAPPTRASLLPLHQITNGVLNGDGSNNHNNGTNVNNLSPKEGEIALVIN